MSTQWAVITGASSGIGRALAGIFAKDNINLYLIARDEQELKKVARTLSTEHSIKVVTHAGDLTDVQFLQDFTDSVLTSGTTIDYVVNNAGFGGYGEFVETKWDHEQQMIRLNVEALTYISKRFGNLMSKQGSGKILNVASIAGFLSGPNMAVYYATKAYVLHFSEALHEELRQRGISVTALCPGPTQTNFARTAHAENTSIFKGSLPSAEEVARFGYEAMIKGKPVAVHGARNRLLVFSTRIVPRQLLTRMVGKTQG